MRVAKAKGAYREGRPSSTRARKRTSSSCTAAGEHSSTELSDLFGVGRSTVHRAIERDTPDDSQPP